MAGGGESRPDQGRLLTMVSFQQRPECREANPGKGFQAERLGMQRSEAKGWLCDFKEQKGSCVSGDAQ